MIDGVRGRLVSRSSDHVVIEVGGIALTLRVPGSAADALSRKELGEEVRVPTHLHVREDALELFGFLDEPQRALFRTLLTVSGVGPRLALSIVGAIPSSAFASAMVLGDVKVLQGAPGVGKKLAQRILLELRDGFPGGLVTTGEAGEAGGAAGPWEDAALALAALGYDGTKIQRVLSSLRETLEEKPAPEALLKAALQAMKG